LLIVGGHDLVTLDHVREMADQVPNADLSVIEDGGHTSLIWHASQVNEQIVDFLRVQGR
jgi:pimeloyl-ACP methyl ester carboxylesterase